MLGGHRGRVGTLHGPKSDTFPERIHVPLQSETHCVLREIAQDRKMAPESAELDSAPWWYISKKGAEDGSADP